MKKVPFHDEITLAEQTELLAKQAMQLGLIPSFAIHHFPDSWQFYIPDFKSEPLTPEEAYLQLQRLIEPKQFRNISKRAEESNA
jgi:hypothetical protein